MCAASPQKTLANTCIGQMAMSHNQPRRRDPHMILARVGIRKDLTNITRNTHFTEDIFKHLLNNFPRRKIVEEFPEVFLEDMLTKLLVNIGSSCALSWLGQSSQVFNQAVV
jgi:hypothetical protein